MKRVLMMLLCLTLLPLSAALAGEGSSNYLYDEHKIAVPAPPAYTLERSLTVRDLAGVEKLDGLVDAYVSDDCVYVLCAARLLLLNRDFSVRQVITS